MKIRKILLLIIIGMFCFVPVVKAEDDIVVKSIKLIEATDGVVSRSTSKVDLEFNDLGQVAKYEVTLKNNTNKSLYTNNLVIDGSSQNFMKYTLVDESRSKIIKPDSKEKITIIVNTTNEKGAGINLSDTISFKLQLNEKIENPNTSSNLISIILLVIVSAIAITFVMTKFNNKKGTIATVIVCFMLLGTSFVFADDTITVNFKGKVGYSSQNYLETSGTVIENHKANYISSKDVWAYSDKVKNINIITDNSVIEKYAYTFDLTTNDKQRIKAYLIENGNAEVPYDLTIVSNGVIYAPEDSTGLFSFPKVEVINGLENVMFDNTVKMTGMFIGNEKLSTMDMSTLDTTNVKDTSYMFHKCLSLNVDESKFNLENIEVRNNMFVQYLKDEIIKDAKTDKDIDFSQPSRSISSYKEVHDSTTENVSMNSSRVYYYGSGYTFDSAKGQYTLTGKTTGTWSAMSSKYATYPYTCLYTFDSSGCSTLYKMTGYTNTTTGVGYKYTSEAIYKLNGEGLYYTSENTEDSKKTYYFRGAVENNYVSFGTYKAAYNYYDRLQENQVYLNVGDPIIWRIVRVNEDGSIRLIAEDPIKNVAFNTNYNDNAYVGYMYGTVGALTYKDTHANINNSTIKTVADEWYLTNLSEYSSYLADAGFCNDRSIASTANSWDSTDTALGYGTNITYYGAYERLKLNSKPQFACPNPDNDLFTTSTSNKGNKALLYPIGLLTFDEVTYAGYTWLGSYLDTSQNSYIWTMTPMNYGASNFNGFNYISSAGMSTLSSVNASSTTFSGTFHYFKPVINLKTNVSFTLEGTGAAGTITNPYVIK